VITFLYIWSLQQLNFVFVIVWLLPKELFLTFSCQPVQLPIPYLKLFYKMYPFNCVVSVYVFIYFIGGLYWHSWNFYFCPISNNPAHRYYLATDPMTGQLYVSDTNSRRIFRPKALTGTKELLQNAEVVAGTGEQCLPFDEARCGDGGKATEALLLGPKGKEAEHL